MAKKKLKRQKRTKVLVWTTKDGRRLLPKQMETAHLIATIRMCMRKTRKYMLEEALDAIAYAGGAPDGAAHAAEGAADEMMHSMDEPIAQLAYARKTWRIVEALYKELATRKLTVNSVLL